MYFIFQATGSGFCVSGKVETGCLNTGDRILICPIREQATIKSVALEDTLNSQVVFAGDQVSITLSGVDIQNVSVGNILCDPQRPVPISTKFEARIVVFNVTVPITKGYSVSKQVNIGNNKCYNCNIVLSYVFQTTYKSSHNDVNYYGKLNLTYKALV